MAVVSEARRTWIIEKYTQGDCGILAIALHKLTGLPLVSLAYEGSLCRYSHFGVREGEDQYWDIRGKLTVAGFRKGFFGNLRVDECTVDIIMKFYENRITPMGERKSLVHFRQLHGRDGWPGRD